MSEQKKCDERIDVHMQNRIDTIRDLWQLYQEDCEAYHDEHQTSLNEYGLTITNC